MRAPEDSPVSFRRYTCGGVPKRAREIVFDNVMWFAVGVRVGTYVDRWTNKDAGNRLPPTPYMEVDKKTEVKLIV